MKRACTAASAALTTLTFAGCSASMDLPANLTIGGRPAPLGAGPTVDFAAPPSIRAVWLSSLTLERGSTWSGEVSTGSNVASIEVRTDSFSFSVPRKSIGTFAFSYAIPDLPPYLRRGFVLHVVARNAAGDIYDEELPIEIN